VLCCVPLVVQAIGPDDQDKLAAMQAVIDQQQSEISQQQSENKQQRSEIDQQRQALETQQQKLAEQQKMLESLQSQLNALAGEPEGVETELAGETPAPEESQSETTGHFVADTVHISPDPALDQPSARSRWTPTALTSERPYLLLDTSPLDVPDDRGVFMHSNDQQKVLRIYGSIRGLAVYDNRQNFHPYDLNIPQVPFGDDDVKDWNQEWTINSTKMGLQFHVGEDLGGRVELDWKGENGDALRIRHMFMRSGHWLVGKHWSAMNTVIFLPLSIDSHSTSAHLGARQVQIKHLGGGDNWAYQTSLEYFKPKFDEPGSVDAQARNILPNLAGNVTYTRPWGLVRGAAMLTSNRVRFDYTNPDRTTSSDSGVLLLAGTRLDINENNLIKAHIQRADGNSGYGADYGFGNYDMVFNPNTGEFQNIKSWGVQAALEHKWTPTLTTSIGGGYMSMDSRSFQPGNSFDHGYKALVNLFYRPGGWLYGLTVAGELEFAGQTTLDGSDGDTTRISVLVYYDF
jgi:hypothetical protein